MTFRSCPPSAADRWGNCPRSVALSKLVPQDEDESWHSVRGHILHEAAAHLFKAAAAFDPPSDVVMRWAPSSLRGALADDAEAAYRVGYVITEHDVNMLSHAVFQAIDIVDPLFATEIHLEAEYPAPRWLPMRRAPRLDLVFVDGEGNMGLIDYKFGRTPVAPDSPQLLIYADALFEAESADEVELWVVQPPNEMRTLTITRDECRRRLDKYAEAALEVQWSEATDKPADYTPGPWCHFCPAKGICPAHKARRRQRAVDQIGHLIEKD